MEDIAAGAPHPGLKCGHAAQFDEAAVWKQSPISDVFQMMVQLVVQLVIRLAAHSLQPQDTIGIGFLKEKNHHIRK